MYRVLQIASVISTELIRDVFLYVRNADIAEKSSSGHSQHPLI